MLYIVSLKRLFNRGWRKMFIASTSIFLLAYLSSCESINNEGDADIQPYRQSSDSLLIINYGEQNPWIQFSHQAGFYPYPFELIFDGEADKWIYTLDGSVPNESSSEYVYPIPIDKSCVIRVRPIVKEEILDTVFTRTFFLGFSTGLPVISLSTDSSNLFNPNTGIYSRGNNPGSYEDLSPGANYWKKWERPVHVEYFDEEGFRVVNQDAGLRIFGGLTRMMSEKSLRIIARKEYGKKRFHYAFFPGKDVSKFKSLVLRTSGGDYRSTRFRDALSSWLVRDLDVDYMAYQPVHFFMNGEYWGIYNLREKINTQYLEENHGAEPDSTDLLQGYQVVENGSVHDYRDLLNYIRSHDLSDDSVFAEVYKRMDVENYANFLITQIYLSNVDARGNIRYWKAKNLDNRFRWIMYDTDLGWGASRVASYDFLKDYMSPAGTHWYNPPWSTFLIRNLLKNENYKHYFIQQVSHLLNTSFHSDSVIRRINQMTAVYELEMDQHLKDRGISYSQWRNEVQEIRDFAAVRPGHFRKHLAKAFELQKSYSLSVEIEPASAGYVEINGNAVRSGPYKGTYFQGINLNVEAVATLLYEFDHWEGTDDTSCLIKTKGNVRSLKAVFRKKERSDHTGKIILSEICYWTKKAEGGDWLEITNLSDEVIDLSSWKLSDNSNTHTLPDGLLINPQQSLVLCRDTHSFNNSVWGVKADAILGFGLSKNGETLSLLDKNERAVDLVSYDSRQYPGQWLLAGKHFSLRLIAPDRNNDFPQNWILTESADPGVFFPVKEEKDILSQNNYTYTFELDGLWEKYWDLYPGWVEEIFRFF